MTLRFAVEHKMQKETNRIQQVVFLCTAVISDENLSLIQEELLNHS